ncbi:MAG: DUF4200 domain-containing protein [Dehalococcoidia bacterium]
MTDLDLLRRYEPVLRFAQGEIFFPCAVDGYVRQCSLWTRARGESRQTAACRLVAAGGLSLDTLGAHVAASPEQTLFLRFVQEPLAGLEYQLWRLRERPPFQAPGRLARVGLTARFADALFSLSLLLRGTVPGGTTAAAARAYHAIVAESPRPVYYGRVVRRDGYLVLHYLFFYVMNDWRSSFFGVNDHEADWEQMFVVLEEDETGAPPEPAWLALAAHERAGDDVRRRWDDPELTLAGDHPVIFIGAGSHAAYFRPGEYVLEVELKFLQPVIRAVRIGRRIWRDVLRQGEADTLVRRIEGLLRVPFVDYARGDGRVIGPGQSATWEPVPIDDGAGWVDGYRGLWGLDTQDLFSGEQAPAGPKYTREGTVRRSWHDPVGWAGLAKVAPGDAVDDALAHHIAALTHEIAEADGRIDELKGSLPGLDLEVRALRGAAHLRRLHAERGRELARREQELNDLQSRRVELAETIAACQRYAERIARGDADDPRAHIRRALEPESPTAIRRGKLVEIWAALSTGLLLLGGVALLVFGVANPLVALIMLVATVVVVENILHRRVQRLLLDITVGLAFATTLVLVYEFYWPVTIGAIAAIAGLILFDNIRELRGR